MAVLKTLKIATRQSPLALWQANFVKDQLEQFHPTLSVELVPMVTKGDVILDSPLAKIGGKGLFVKELENALLEKTCRYCRPFNERCTDGISRRSGLKCDL